MSADIILHDEPTAWSYGGAEVRTVVIDDTVWWVAPDVAEVLGLASRSSSVALLDPSDVRLHTVETKGGVRRQTTLVSEGGLYQLIMRSRRPEAKAFARWVTHTVLPEIRRTGSYGPAPAPELPSYPEALRQLAAEIDANAALVGQLEAARPALEAHADLLASDGDLSVREAAQALCRCGIDTGQNRLHQKLRAMAWVDRRGTPMQSAIQAGWLAAKTTTWTDPRGRKMVDTQIRVTGKGLDRLRQLLGGRR